MKDYYFDYTQVAAIDTYSRLESQGYHLIGINFIDKKGEIILEVGTHTGDQKVRTELADDESVLGVKTNTDNKGNHYNIQFKIRRN